MGNVYLISETTLKKKSLINDNTLVCYIKPAIQVAQDINLTNILGNALVDKLCKLVSTKQEGKDILDIDLPENEHYKYLIQEHIQNFMIYDVMGEIQLALFSKMRNAGIVSNQDTNYQQNTMQEVQYMKRHYKDIAENYGSRMVKFIKAHQDWYKEYNCSCSKKDTFVYSCGIVLD